MVWGWAVSIIVTVLWTCSLVREGSLVWALVFGGGGLAQEVLYAGQYLGKGRRFATEDVPAFAEHVDVLRAAVQNGAVAAALSAANPGWTEQQVIDRLISSADLVLKADGLLARYHGR